MGSPIHFCRQMKKDLVVIVDSMKMFASLPIATFLGTLALYFCFPFSAEGFRQQRKVGESACCECNFLPGSRDCQRNNADSTQTPKPNPSSTLLRIQTALPSGRCQTAYLPSSDFLFNFWAVTRSSQTNMAEKLTFVYFTLFQLLLDP